MRASAEGQMGAAAIAPRDKLPGVGPDRLVAIGRSDRQQHTLARLNRNAVERDRLSAVSGQNLDRRIKPQDLFHNLRNQVAVVLNPLQQGAIRCQPEQQIADQVARRAVAGNDKKHHLRLDGAHRQALARNLRLGESGNDVIRRFGAGLAIDDMAADICGELIMEIDQGGIGAGARPLPVQQFVGPLGEAIDIAHRHAQQIGDDRAGQTSRQSLHQFCLASADRRFNRFIGELLGQRPDKWLVARYLGQGRQEDAANLAVPGFRNAGKHDILVGQGAAVRKGAGETFHVAHAVGRRLVADRDAFAARQIMHRALAPQLGESLIAPGRVAAENVFRGNRRRLRVRAHALASPNRPVLIGSRLRHHVGLREPR